MKMAMKQERRNMHMEMLEISFSAMFHPMR